MWSSQRFIRQGLARGISQQILDAAVEQVEALAKGPIRLPAILTLGHLAQRTDVSYISLRRLVADEYRHPYRTFTILKRKANKSGYRGRREISVPTPELLTVQRWLSAHVLRQVRPHPASHAFSPGGSIVKCASEHCNAKWLIKLDIADFFGSISEIQIYHAFRKLGYQPLISFELARLCTDRPRKNVPPAFVRGRNRMPSGKVRFKARVIDQYDHRYIGYLPQGAPTSPMLANLVMRDIDVQLAAIASRYELRYTRYSDDINFSTTENFSRDKAHELIQRVAKCLIKKGLGLNKSKTTIAPPGAKKLVLGLLVDTAKPRLCHQFKDRLRQHIYYIERFGIEAHAQRRAFDTTAGFIRHIKGLLDFAYMVEPAYALDLTERLQVAVFSWDDSFVI
ncbi:RNA-directed DNA polymerase [Pseudomonas neustonica]|uniref:RNA-directed DNA polymerase n=1 Tax=Pseudomonas neustonica TaxID=2487346 RepID=A0ABX9XGS7_9PSED|nr:MULTISPECIES: reverse transcriptase family protein [Pseudomonas]ROZ79290.1 RNA-directed DNA polymerase [Pseudomonas sp. SSM44]ROZ80314.1 RNA-directed DNA polymerase [Pseudomonas neustonica]